MATEQEIAYHRTFLSPFYMDNFRPRPLPKNVVEEIRLRDPEEFEQVRKELAQAFKARYTPGGMVQVGHDLYTTREYREGSPVDMQVAGYIEAAFPPQTVAKDPKTGRVALPIPTTRIRAYQEYGNRLHTVIIHPKTDQEFMTYATPFETDFSVLRLPNYGHDMLALDRVNVFAPIVNTSWKVFGHIGRLSGASPDVVVPDWTRGLDLKQLHDTGTPAFVHDLKYPAPGGYIRLPRLSVGGSEVSFVVRTTLDGEIVDFQLGPSSGFVEPHWFSPLDIIVAVRILASLAKAGSGYVSSIMRRRTATLASRAELRGATQALARESEEKAAKVPARKAEEQAAKAGGGGTPAGGGPGIPGGGGPGPGAAPMEWWQEHTMVLTDAILEVEQYAGKGRLNRLLNRRLRLVPNMDHARLAIHYAHQYWNQLKLPARTIAEELRRYVYANRGPGMGWPSP
jgi:hypothetical protein